ncbi:alpha/beta fold hydrolase [Phenylobacterium sp. J367]|uniref:alpha/beta fold hydrolase n=1 Tax=Phenylobacterium sp. J367 TaxID=2898435 RepID=UPI002150FBD0|nr:alpha/beta hydrolase [Phenylobacterium sp. J367]MCR5880805.1 alpha/beta hydrolase [Phenylobacterium sp. J367]
MRLTIPLVLIGLACALLAGCVARDIPYAELEARYASPASRFADLGDGLRIHYRDEGPRDAPAVVLVHGFAASLHAWEPWRARLGDRYRLVTLDLPGHGLTQAPETYAPSTAASVEIVDRLAGQLGLGRFVIGGNSMGGGVAWSYALAHPDKVRGLVLVNAAGWPAEREGGPPPLVFQLLGNPVGRTVLRNVDPALMARDGLEKAYGEPRLVTDDLLTRYVELARAPGHRGILTTRRAGDRQVTPATFAAIKAPTLILAGEKDQVIPVANQRGFAGAIPGARLIVYPDGGHVPMEQLPDRTAADLDAFLKTLAP